MYRYTPNPGLLRGLKNARANPYTPNGGQWGFASCLCIDYSMTIAFLQYWEHVVYWSPKKLQKVPVNGLLFPVSFFKEEQVDATLD